MVLLPLESLQEPYGCRQNFDQPFQIAHLAFEAGVDFVANFCQFFATW
jgi:hypothetical protein